MAQTLFNLGFPGSSAPWAYQHSLGISTKDIETWWKSTYPTLKSDLEKGQAAGLGPGNKPLPLTPGQPGYVPPAPPPSSGGPSGTVVISLLVVGAAVGGLYYYKSKEGRLPWEKNGKKAKAS